MDKIDFGNILTPSAKGLKKVGRNALNQQVQKANPGNTEHEINDVGKQIVMVVIQLGTKTQTLPKTKIKQREAEHQ